MWMLDCRLCWMWIRQELWLKHTDTLSAALADKVHWGLEKKRSTAWWIKAELSLRFRKVKSLDWRPSKHTSSNSFPTVGVLNRLSILCQNLTALVNSPRRFLGFCVLVLLPVVWSGPGFTCADTVQSPKHRKSKSKERNLRSKNTFWGHTHRWYASCYASCLYRQLYWLK